MQNIFIIPIEPIDTRYTKQWYNHLPKLLRQHAPKHVQIIQIAGQQIPSKPTPGAFLDFAATNIYKSSQLIKIAKLFREDRIVPGDKFLFTDAWNPCIIQVKYMSELLNIPVEIHAMFHAGSYDPADFLGRLIKDKRWTNNFEKAIFHAVDYNWFATEFHIEMFKTNVFRISQRNKYESELSSKEIETKYCRTGWPMEYMVETLAPYANLEKQDLILFPHRIAPEKQVEIFRDLEKEMPEYEWVVCQDQELTKHEFHTLLGKAKIVFSANLQETLGISTCIEGPLSGALPLAPDRLSYTEIFEGYNQFLYPKAWTKDWGWYQTHRNTMANHIRRMMNNYDSLRKDLNEFNTKQVPKYFGFDNAIKVLFKND